ncbi:diguanylate cyclase [Photobacterium sagamiensis]|uniref:tetratricopeptide repeat-containing diguanylate cyclase n=1 Tax=Photobacterium sagamiensis TaxID=2910241 RepID=UPI003D11AF9E
MAAPQDRGLLEIYMLADTQPDKARKRLKQLPLEQIQRDEGFRLALYYLILFKLENALGAHEVSAEEYIDDLKALGDRQGQEWMVGEALLEYVINLIKHSEFDEGLEFVGQVIEIAETSDYSHLLARALKWRANIHVERSHYNRAMDDYRSAMKIFREQHDEIELSKVLSNISTVYFRLEEWDRAAKYNQKAFSQIENGGYDNPNLKAMLHINAGIIARHFDLSEQEAEHIREAVKLFEQTGAKFSQLAALNNLITMQLKDNEIEAALANSFRCLELATEISDRSGMAHCNESLAEAYLMRGELKKAAEIALQALEVFNQLQDQKNYMETSELIADIYEAAGDYQRALQYYRQYATEGKEYLFDERRKELFALQESYEAEARDHEIVLLKSENELKTARLAEQEAREELWIFVTVFTVLLLYIFYRRYSNISQDNTQLQQSNATLATQSLKDPLTGLHNRRHLEQWLESVGNDSRSSPYHYLLVELDLDHFKQVNDRWGHDVGDQVLVEVARRLKKSARSNDLVIRWGGEEFVLVLALKPDTGAELILNRLRESIATVPVNTSQGDLKVTVSIGAVGAITIDVMINEWDVLLNKADKALYAAKSSGRNCVELSSY